MPKIFDNISLKLLPTLQESLKVAYRADFCVGYFNLRGWRYLDEPIGKWNGGEGTCCRLLVGMQQAPKDELRAALSLNSETGSIDNATAIRLKNQLAREFKEQLTVGAPTAADEEGLRRLARQLRARKVIAKLFLRHTLHAKLYLTHRVDHDTPIIGYLGSSNLTFSGLSHQGELNVNVVEQDAADKLAAWFDDRWNDRFSLDISDELAQIIEESWARETPIPPYHIYLKMAYHLAEEARAGKAQFPLPKRFDKKLLKYQEEAISLAARHVERRGGVVIGDVVGLGKTLLATALAAMFEDRDNIETLILCPKNLVSMWQYHREEYGLRGTVLSTSKAIQRLPELRRYRLIIIDESHNLRNREGKVYKAIKEYIEENDSRCILLTATPYNKTYLDIANQLRLFIPDDKDIGVRPEQYIRAIGGEEEFTRRHQCSPRTLQAFAHSAPAYTTSYKKSDKGKPDKEPPKVYPDDWRELMRLYMVRRTRSFIQAHYTKTEEKTGRKYLVLPGGGKSFFPTRLPKTLTFETDAQYAALYHKDVVDIIDALRLPRYGLGEYGDTSVKPEPTKAEKEALQKLSRAGDRLKGFCKTNLFKRLESSGRSFLLSVERHILRNYIFLYAIENGKPLPIGTQTAELLDTRFTDEEENGTDEKDTADSEDEATEGEDSPPIMARTPDEFRRRAEAIYGLYEREFQQRFRWIAPRLFRAALKRDLTADTQSLLKILALCNQWEAGKDEKLLRLRKLLVSERPNDKVLVFTQFADTARYLRDELVGFGIDKDRIGCATGKSDDPTALAWRFSPVSNNKRPTVKAENELRVLIATDVLSEGQNLQDSFIVVNYDLPWAIIRLIQRAGRVDRIGQKAEEILCYSFLPAEGVENIIDLRRRVKDRLKQNAEVIGTDELFFEDDTVSPLLNDLYHEKSGVLDDDEDNEVDLSSYAYQIWKNACDADPAVKRAVEALPAVVYSAKEGKLDSLARSANESKPNSGALVYLRTGEGNDALAWIDENGESVTESQYAILRAAECAPDTPALPRPESHHELVGKGVKMIVREGRSVGGQLGRPSGARNKTYERLKKYATEARKSLLDEGEGGEALEQAIDEIYHNPLTRHAADALNVQLKANAPTEALISLVLSLRDDNRLCVTSEEADDAEPSILCSLALVPMGDKT